MEEHLGVDVAADLTCLGGRVEQASEGRPEALEEVGRQRLERRISGVQGRREPAFRSDEVGEALEPFRQSLRRLVGLDEGRRGVGRSIDLTVEHGDDQIGAKREVAVERGRAHAGSGSDSPDRHVDAVLGELLFSGDEERVDVALGIGTRQRAPLS